MDKRRKAFGLRKLPVKSKENQLTANSVDTGHASVSEENKDKEKQSNHLGNETPKQKSLSRKKNATPLKSESPGTPLQSPGYQPVFLANFGSPEIEVSWDWGCSQVPKDMLPPKGKSRTSESQSSTTFIAPVITSCPILPLSKQMTEEENQERLAFYKNILSRSLKRVSEDVLVDSRNNNTQKTSSPEIITPKRSTRLSKALEKKEELNNEFFDDSANEFMLECSQAIEEKLKNGEIDMGPIVTISLPYKTNTPKGKFRENTQVTSLKSKANLFPESNHDLKLAKEYNNKKQRLSLKSPQNKLSKTNQFVEKLSNVDSNDEVAFENDDILFMQPTQAKKVPQPKTDSLKEETSVTTKINSNEQNINSSKSYFKDIRQLNKSRTDTKLQVVQGISVTNKETISNPSTTCNGNINSVAVRQCERANNCDKVDRFRKPQNSVRIPPNKINNNTSKPTLNTVNGMDRSCSVNVVKSGYQVPTVQDNKKYVGLRPENICHNVQRPKCDSADFNSLLDDGLDMELSTIDFESLCDSKNNVPQSQHANKSVSKVCSQEEIEAKRLAALNRLQMRKKK